MSNFSVDKLTPEYIFDFQAYIPSKPDSELKKIYGCKRLHRLNNNENPLGSPKDLKKIIDAYDYKKFAIYPSGDSYFLRQKLAKKFHKDPEQFIIGNGANEVISFVIKAFCQKGDNIITADKTYAVYEWLATFSDIDVKLTPLKDFSFDEKVIIEAIDKKSKVIFICNPNNPTGTYWSKEKFASFMNKINNRTVVVLDEAYFEFVSEEDYPNGMDLLEKYPNLLVFRTFSKMYALAGLRIGYLVGNLDVVEIIKKVRVVYSVNTLAQISAECILDFDDTKHIENTQKLIKEGKAYLKKELDTMNLPYVIGVASYIMIKLPISDTLAYRKLMTHGIMIRPMTDFRFPNYIRVTISHLHVMKEFISALKEILT
jgi:histidinol-phosphate aminotransferase